MPLREQVIQALTLYKERWAKENSGKEIEEIKSHTTIRCGVGAYFSSESPSDFAEIKFLDVAYNHKVNAVEIKYGEGQDPYPIDLTLWAQHLLKTIKTNKISDRSLSAFKLGGMQTFKPEEGEINREEFIECRTKALLLENLLDRDNITMSR